MKKLPFFAPFNVGPFRIHGEPIGDDAVMVWVIDQRTTECADAWEGVTALQYDYAPTQRKRERLAWQMRREITDEVLSHT